MSLLGCSTCPTWLGSGWLSGPFRGGKDLCFSSPLCPELLSTLGQVIDLSEQQFSYVWNKDYSGSMQGDFEN